MKEEFNSSFHTPHSTLPVVCIRLKHLLARLNITQEEAVRHVPCSWRTLGRILAGQRPANRAERVAIEAWLDSRGISTAGIWDLVEVTRRKIASPSVPALLLEHKEEQDVSWDILGRRMNRVPWFTLLDFSRGRAELPEKYKRRVGDYMVDAGLLEEDEPPVKRQLTKKGEKRERPIHSALMGEPEVTIRTIEERENAMRRTPKFLTDAVLTHFGFRNDPFTAGVMTERDVWMNPQVRYGIEIIEQGLRRQKGILAFYGRSGSGKTVLMKLAQRRLMTSLADVTKLVTIADVDMEAMTPRDFITNVYRELKPNTATWVSTGVLEKRLIRELISLRDHGRQLVVFMDEAHALSDKMLRCLKRFIELVDKDPSIGYTFPILIVLFGHTQLEHNLQGSDIEEVRGRVYMTEVTMHSHQVMKYVAHKVGRALDGKDAWDVIDQDAVKAMRGDLTQKDAPSPTPLDVNILLSRAFYKAYELKKKKVDTSAMQHALREI